ncbi:MAG: hypothetical protein ACETVZ_08020 [Phycisphaerae bacterium]
MLIKLPRRDILSELMWLSVLAVGRLAILGIEGLFTVIELLIREVLLWLKRLFRLRAVGFRVMVANGCFLLTELPIRNVSLELGRLPRLIMGRFPIEELNPVDILLLEGLGKAKEL